MLEDPHLANIIGKISQNKILFMYDKVIIRTQSAPITPEERGVQCIASVYELDQLRILYFKLKQLPELPPLSPLVL